MFHLQKFKTMKENTARIKTCFGSVVNPSNIKKDYIVCKRKSERKSNTTDAAVFRRV